MKINELTQAYFNEYENDIFDEVNFKKGANLFLNGSYAIPYYSLFASDIDLYQRVEPEFINSLIRFVKVFISQVNFIEVKAGNKKYKTIKAFISTPVKTIYKQIFSGDKPYLKIDFWAFDGKFIDEISIIYHISDYEIDQDEVKDGLIRDVDKYFGSNNFKVLKRLKDLFKLRGEKRNEKRVNDLIDREALGYLYSIRMRLESMLRIKGHQSEKSKSFQSLKGLMRKALGNVEIIKQFSKYSKANINKIISWIDQYINRKTRAEIKNIIMSL